MQSVKNVGSIYDTFCSYSHAAGISRDGVENTRLEAKTKVKDKKNLRL